MDRRRSRLARRLGGPEVRRRRHRRWAAAAALVLAVGGVFVFVLGDDNGDGDGGDEARAADALCATFGERVQDEFALSFPEGVPSNAAFAEYLSRAFADTMDELVAELRALPLAGELADATDDLDARIADVRAAPEEHVASNPFGEVAARFDELGAPACGSGFFPAPA